MYLALALVQIVGAGRVSSLRRKAEIVRDVVRTNGLRAERPTIARINGQLLRLELQLERLSILFLKISCFLIVVSLIGVSLVTLYPAVEVSSLGVGLFLGFYLGLPVIAFICAALIVHIRSAPTEKEIAAAKLRILGRL